MKGRKRHALVDTDGRLIKVIVHPADIQDRDGGVMLLKASRRSFPFVELVFADGAYAGKRVADATCITVQIVRKAEGQVGFKLHKRRWVVERFFAWIGRNRRFSPDVERLVTSVQAFIDCRLDEIVACDMEYEEARTIAADALHVIRTSLPLLARTAQMDLAEVAGQGMTMMRDASEEAAQ